MTFPWRTSLASSLLIPTVVSAVGIQVMIDGRAVIFTDVSQSAWFASYVRDAAEAGIVNGYMDARGRLTGKLGPSNSITFAEAIKIAAEGAGYDEALYGSSVQSGVGQHWSSPYVAVAKAEHFAVMQEHFRLDQPATRAQVASMFTSAFGVKTTDIGPVDSRYTDVKVSTQYAASIEALSRDGILSGDTDTRGEATGTFRPMVPINRAEVVKMVIEGVHAVDMVRKLAGNTMPSAAEMGTIRGDYSVDSAAAANRDKRAVRNLVHASETPEEAAHEMDYWFAATELHPYTRAEEDVMF